MSEAKDPYQEVYDKLKDDPELGPKLEEVGQAVLEGRLTLAQVGGFTDDELDGAYKFAANLVEQDRSLEALKYLGSLMLIDPDKGRYSSLTGLALHRIGQLQLADTYYELSLSLEEDAITLLYAGEVKLAMGYTPYGIRLLEKGIALAGSMPQFEPYVARGKKLLELARST